MPLGSTQFNRAFVFYAITLALAIVVRLFVPWIGEASLPLTMLTPTIAAVIMLVWLAPEGGFRTAIASLGLTRAGFKGWPLAIGGPAIIHAVGLAVLALAGLTILAMPDVGGPAYLVIPDILAGLVIGTVFALGEEVGWRGYMLPRLTGMSVIAAMLLVGFLHGVWHLPIMLTTDYYHSSGNPLLVVPLFLVTVTLAGIFYGFLRIWTGSVWPVAIAHAAANTAWNISGKVATTQSPMVQEYIGGESGVIMIVGLMVFGYFIVRYMRSGRFNAA